MRFRVVEGMQVQRGPAVLTAGEEFEATGDEAKEWQASGLVERVDQPASKGKGDK